MRLSESEKKIVAEVKALYDEHDHIEALLIAMNRREKWQAWTAVWDHHDELERDIIDTESRLSPRIVDLLKKGEL